MKLTYNNKRHAYWLDGRRCKSVTTVAKIPDDTYGLDQWRKRQVVIGMASNPALIERAAAHFDDRDTIDTIAEEALVAAKAHDAAGRGTAAHRITERVDLDLAWIDTPLAQTVRQQWTRALDIAGLEVVPDLVERVVVFPDWHVCGRFDRICRRTTDDRHVVVDVKTGEGAIKYPHGTATQLAMYANAPLMAGPLPEAGGDTHTFDPLPDGLDRTVGIVVYLPPEGDPQVYEIDIAAGWRTVTNICFPTLAWRANKTLVAPVAAAVPAGENRDGDRQPDPVPSAAAGSPDRIGWLRQRIKLLVAAGLGRKVAEDWPPGVPTVKQGGLTDHDIDQIVLVAARIEAEHGIPFGATDPLFAPFTPSPAPAAAMPADPGPDPAHEWTAKARAVLDQFDEPEGRAIRDLLFDQPVRTNQQRYQWIAAVADELARPDGAVTFTYGPNGPTITPTPGAGDRVKGTGTKSGALIRAKRLAQALERPGPRTFDQLCANPALAALVAAGLGGAETQTITSQEDAQ